MTSKRSNLLERLERLVAVGIELSAEPDADRTLGHIVDAALELTDADGCTLYLARDGALHFEIIRNNSLALRLGGPAGERLTLTPIPLRQADGSANLHAVSAAAANRRRTINLEDVYAVTEYDFSGARAFDQANGYRSQSFLTVPLIDHEDEIMGVLQLINALDPASGQVVAFDRDSQYLAESLASQAAMLLNKRQLISRLEALFIAFIKVINAALDEKSPYTHGHCQRVPIITMLLAEAADRTRAGPLKDFVLDDAMRRELELAALMHDCGKITTPVHVVDKSTKLETLFDRIALVDTRIEVLRRDARIRALEAQLARLAPDAGWRAEVDAGQAEADAELDAARTFLRRINQGGEAMSEQDTARLGALAGGYRWHGPDGAERPLLDAEEAAMLAIPRGTLSDAERGIINRHIDMTIAMLEALPWPKHLRHVTEYAAGHHERMDGKGYPRGLTGDQMSIPARMMAIADIFEALTARDRPYKPGKPLSETLAILGRMKVEQHIDPDLFDVFMRERVYMDYARRYLDPEQNDDPDVRTIPGYNPDMIDD
ncbi:GAF domain-containing protein [Parasulfuritortus cantonensis]|uniref:GAF domain-containing protein n=1 Tax=Parasulfuritortus cantonensis TaxID=2528202 RepID=A0A4V2NVV5_9PROT|nr:HD domain-containing phosphohydrolase [Parasulfuritortus cantonensis]TCJ15042.1 GAF domain-containing protein [Parasulfuritortus cantonensis]